MSTQKILSESRSKTKILLAQLTDKVNKGQDTADVEQAINQNFKVIYKFREKE
jgi:hypothetical protein